VAVVSAMAPGGSGDSFSGGSERAEGEMPDMPSLQPSGPAVFALHVFYGFEGVVRGRELPG